MVLPRWPVRLISRRRTTGTAVSHCATAKTVLAQTALRRPATDLGRLFCSNTASSSRPAARLRARPLLRRQGLPIFCEKSTMRVRIVCGRMMTSACSASAEPRHDTSTAMTMSAPMSAATTPARGWRRRRRRTRCRGSPPARTSRGTLAEARTAIPVLPRLNTAMRLSVRSAATAAKASAAPRSAGAQRLIDVILQTFALDDAGAEQREVEQIAVFDVKAAASSSAALMPRHATKQRPRRS